MMGEEACGRECEGLVFYPQMAGQHEPGLVMPASPGKVSAGSQWMVCALPKLEASSGAISVMHASRAGPDRWRMWSAGELHRPATDGGLEVLDTCGCKS